MDHSRLSFLFELYINQRCSEAEENELMQLLEDPANKSSILPIINKFITEKEETARIDNKSAIDMLQAIFASNKNQTQPATPLGVHRVHFLRTAWFRYAAAIIAILGISAYLWLNNRNQPALTANNGNKPVSTDITHGNNKATLTLADGNTILLDGAATGSPIQKDNNILRLDANQLAYNRERINANGVEEFNTVTTPRGAQYQIVLPDGSKVWLNAASSLRFPTAFVGKERKVEVTGEAYLEIAKNSKQPFFVTLRQAQGNGTEIQVLGTAFNVNAYAEESIVKTTLINGSIKVNTASASEILKPGQQAQIRLDREDKNNRHITIRQTNIEQVLAWKNGVFNFNDASLEDVMNQLARWYDLKIVYTAGVTNIQFWGELDRSQPLSEVLLGLKDSDVHFKLEGRNLIVLP
jgi:ferric-dicitrate binding protein FerR (iron transport regulator)